MQASGAKVGHPADATHVVDADYVLVVPILNAPLPALLLLLAAAVGKAGHCVTFTWWLSTRARAGFGFATGGARWVEKEEEKD